MQGCDAYHGRVDPVFKERCWWVRNVIEKNRRTNVPIAAWNSPVKDSTRCNTENAVVLRRWTYRSADVVADVLGHCWRCYRRCCSFLRLSLVLFFQEKEVNLPWSWNTVRSNAFFGKAMKSDDESSEARESNENLHNLLWNIPNLIMQQQRQYPSPRGGSHTKYFIIEVE